MEKRPKIIFVRVGWMKFYSRSDDERPIGGVAYNKKRKW
jgi:hypothetical protein